MARGVNKVILVGHLGADPEMKYTPAGTPLCTFSMATSESFKDRNGNQQEKTEWHRVVVWARLAEICGQYLAKGRQVYVEGKITTRSWEDQQGQTRYMTEIVAREVQFLGNQSEGSGARTGSQSEGYGGRGQDESQRYGGGQGGNIGGGGGQRGGGSQGGYDRDFWGGPPPSDDDIPF